MNPDFYDVIYADPPWDYYGSPTKMAAAGKHYDLMPDKELIDFPVIRESLSKRGALFMWATSPRLDFALKLLDAWDLHYRGGWRSSGSRPRGTAPLSARRACVPLS